MPIDLITLTAPQSAAAEAYRALRTHLMFSYGAPRAFVVASPGGEDVKGVAAANLAVTLAQGGRSAMLVDADLRQPTQHQIWDLDLAPGLSEWIGGKEEAPHQHTLGIEKLQVLTAGALPPNPADLLSSRRFEEVVVALRERAEFVIFDAPPVLSVTDAALLAAKTDGLLLVTRAGATRRDEVARAKDEIERIGADVIGAVLTDIPASRAAKRYAG